MARGDHLYVTREFLNIHGVYEHHGIDYGDGTVIHYRKSDSTIARTSMAVFSDGKPVYVQHYTTAYIPDSVLQRAESRLGERQYNLIFNNCEHFATWCKTGRSESRQVTDAVRSLGTIGAYDLYQLLEEALNTSDRKDAPALLNQALTDIATAQVRLQPQYTQALQEAATWDRVAIRAFQQGREDLARAALKRKLEFRKQAIAHKTQLDQLEGIANSLSRHRTNLQARLY
ncbi:MAG: lecithin retinol acyltransferase family protein [Leptolyngbyaceae bacterium]|nr:lecithin retinol acyltransferase family protein [Leptolyngbyaceae bacterium]